MLNFEKYVDLVHNHKTLIFSLTLLFISLTFLSCTKKPAPESINNVNQITGEQSTPGDKGETKPQPNPDSEDKDLWDMPPKMGLIKIEDAIPGIRIDLKYATTDNFVGENMYGNGAEAWLQPDAMKMLKSAQERLKSIHPNYTLIIYDAARPQRVQERMWEIVKGTKFQSFVASPQNVSLHSYGVAVDISIWDKKTSAPLDMGTPFDSFLPESGPVSEAQMLKEGKLTQKHIDNRKLLRKVMFEAGFQGVNTEWWHFNTMTRPEAKEKYKPIP